MKKRVDVSTCERTKEGYYILTEDMISARNRAPVDDYRDMVAGRVIWHVARNEHTGMILGTEGELYQEPGWRTLWLR